MRDQFSPEIERLRKQAAEGIREGRKTDRQPGFEITRSRGIALYVKTLGGLKHFLDYARSLPDSEKAKVLDIGAGTTKALSELASIEDWSENLDLSGTSLTSSPKVDSYLGRENLTLTSVENLRGIKDGELAGVISVHGAGWTKAPRLAAESIDRVLMPSGILKCAFAFDPKDKTDPRERYQKTFINFFKHFKYDTYVNIRNVPNVLNIPGMKIKDTIFLAIKPPIKKGFSASSLAKADFEDMRQQLDFLTGIDLN
ncbi:MAG TPA: hypothetical protein VE973_03765 [Candidatus Limnocylindria bacterium]|nr:hypothetical protein [Candidatus Limnocylindria bacterium]